MKYFLRLGGFGSTAAWRNGADVLRMKICAKFELFGFV